MEAVEKAIDLLGGIETFVKPGDSVLIKPNLLSAKPPEAAVTTHPNIVEAVVTLWQKAGALPIVGDSPPLAGEKKSSYQRLLKITGMSDMASHTGVPLVRFEEEDTVTVEQPEGRFYKKFEIAGAVHKTDALISIPKLKTHGLTYLTGAVKNIFGCIPGKRKALFHAQAGEDRQVFAQMLVDLLRAVRPRLSIIDAVEAMDGDGPVDGRVRKVGLIMAGADPVALDAVAAEILGADAMSIHTTRLAAAQGLGVGDLSEIEILGERLEDVITGGFREPRSRDLWTSIPGPIRYLLKNQLIAFPRITPNCKNCGACVKECPMTAIKAGTNRPTIDLANCIRCYCCREVCEYGAIDLRIGRINSSFRLIREARRAFLRRHKT